MVDLGCSSGLNLLTGPQDRRVYNCTCILFIEKVHTLHSLIDGWRCPLCTHKLKSFEAKLGMHTIFSENKFKNVSRTRYVLLRCPVKRYYSCRLMHTESKPSSRARLVGEANSTPIRWLIAPGPRMLNPAGFLLWGLKPSITNVLFYCWVFQWISVEYWVFVRGSLGFTS